MTGGMTVGFTGGTLDRADRLRHDAGALAKAAADPRARLLALDGLTPATDGNRLRWRPVEDAEALILLGLDADGRPHFAPLPSAGSDDGGQAMRAPVLMTLLDGLAPGEAATYAAARSLVLWHARNCFCANCGAPTAPFRAGWGRSCPRCRAEHFPRTDPVVIMIAEHDGRALLGRQASWPPGRYSALAGFVEPGESVEEAVARETWEEAGVRVSGIRYVASQPWPFASSLMIACIGTAEDDALTLDPTELEDAIWVDRDTVARVLAGGEGPFLAPPPYAIAHTLLSEWVNHSGEPTPHVRSP